MRTEALVSSSAQTLHFLICIWGLPKNEHLDYISVLPLLSSSCCLSSCISKNWKAEPFTSLFLWFILLIWVISLPFAAPWISLKGGRRARLCCRAGVGSGEGAQLGHCHHHSDNNKPQRTTLTVLHSHLLLRAMKFVESVRGGKRGWGSNGKQLFVWSQWS